MSSPELIHALTHPRSPELTPELTLHLARALSPLWQRADGLLQRLQIATPFWAFAWPGGQALARFLLDHPHTTHDLRVLDLASGSGIAAIAAALGCATHVTALDRDPLAAHAAAANARLNHTHLHTLTLDPLAHPLPEKPDLILAGDIFYDAQSDAFHHWLRQQASHGVRVLIGDPGRPGLPHGLQKLAQYRSPAALWLHDDSLRNACVYELLAGS